MQTHTGQELMAVTYTDRSCFINRERFITEARRILMSGITKKLGVKERLLIGGLLPDRGSIADLRILRELENEISFSQDEHQQLNIKNSGGLMTWNDKGDTDKKAIQFCDRAVALISEKLKELDKQGQLHKDFIDIWTMFVTDKEDEKAQKK